MKLHANQLSKTYHSRFILGNLTWGACIRTCGDRCFLLCVHIVIEYNCIKTYNGILYSTVPNSCAYDDSAQVVCNSE